MSATSPVARLLQRFSFTGDAEDSEAPVDGELVKHALEEDEKLLSEDAAFESAIQNQVLRDRSPRAKAGRRRMLARAVYGEFMATLLLFGPLFMVYVNGYESQWSPEIITLTGAFVAGFQVIGLCFAFSGISGAILNPAVCISLWSTGKLSNRRCLYFIVAEMLASVVAVALVTIMYSGDLGGAYKAIAIAPQEGANLGKVFATEFFLIFFLTYTAFTVAFENAEAQKKETMSIKKISDSKGLTVYASTPQSSTGFAPFAIGFIVFSVSLAGGTGGSALNPARMFGPAIFSGKWDYFYVYWLGEISGAITAALLVNNLHKVGLNAMARENMATRSASTVMASHTQELVKLRDGVHISNPMGENNV